MKDSDLMPFGKYKGEKLGDVPADYLLWLVDQGNVRVRYPELYRYVDQGRAHLEKEAKNKSR